jgi:tRNA pseudouridine55 synthase
VTSPPTASGFLLVDKPPGLTSFGVVERVRRWTKIGKVGHTGTLDPFATGLLVLCLGRATRLARYITDWEKLYIGTVRLGVETDTDDPTGEVVRQAPVPAITDATLDRALKSFRGTIVQRPPRFSAKKQSGIPSYRLARQGKEVDLEPVTVRIIDLDVIGRGGTELQIRVRCSKGTYMRSLARDLGRVLGCGGHLAGLRRIAVGHLTVDDAFSLDCVKGWRRRDSEQWILPAGRIFSTWAAISLSDEEAGKVRHGQDFFADPARTVEGGQRRQGDWVRLVGKEGEFLAVGRVVESGTEGMRIHPETVFAERAGRYLETANRKSQIGKQ